MKLNTSKRSSQSLLLVFIMVLFGLFTALTAFAAPGDLDTDFNSPNGYNTLDLGLGYSEYGTAVAVQDDGKIIVGGWVYNSGSIAIVLARYNADGTLDTTGFGSPNGFVTTVIGANPDLVDIAIQSDGKIVVVGSDNASSYGDIIVARYNSDGSLDTTGFGAPNGYVILNFGVRDYGTAVAIQSDGKIVVGGHYTLSGAAYDIVLLRLNTDGSLDTTGFGSPNGYVISNFLGEDQLYDIVIQNDNKIVAVGDTYTSGQADFLVARYETDGNPDTTFSSDGYVTTDVASATYSEDCFYSVVIQKDGKILAGGKSYNFTTNTSVYLLARYSSAGVLDTSGFGSPNGYVSMNPTGSTYDSGRKLVQQADGKIVFVGGGDGLGLVRFNPDGSLDTGDFGFGSGTGKVVTKFSGELANGESVAIQPKDGKIVVVGQRAGSSWIYDVLVARFLVAASETATIANEDFDTLVDVDIYNHSGQSCDFTVTKYPVPPGGIPADPGEMPVQWDVASTCTTVNVDLDFRYTEDELYYGNNVTESNLTAFKNTSGDTWTDQCSTFACMSNADDNIFSVSGVTSLSSWTLGDPTSTGNTDPTSVNVTSVKGTSLALTGMLVALVGICLGFAALIVRKKLIKT